MKNLNTCFTFSMKELKSNYLEHLCLQRLFGYVEVLPRTSVMWVSDLGSWPSNDLRAAQMQLLCQS